MTGNKYIDEFILDKKNEIRELNRIRDKRAKDKKIEDDIKTGSVEIDGEQIQFKRKTLFKDKISIYVPKDFKQDDINDTYTIFSSENSDRNIVITLMPEYSKELTIDEYKKKIEEKMQEQMKTLIEWNEEGFVFLGSNKITYFAFTTPVETDICYNFIFFTEIKEQALIFNFNCTGDIIYNWERVGKGIMNSLEINES
jgi:hypothetical protein